MRCREAIGDNGLEVVSSTDEPQNGETIKTHVMNFAVRLTIPHKKVAQVSTFEKVEEAKQELLKIKDKLTDFGGFTIEHGDDTILIVRDWEHRLIAYSIAVF